MNLRKMVLIGLILCACIICMIVCLDLPTFSQFYPWSWPPGGPFPSFGQIPLSTWPQPSYFPTAGLSTTSGWPVYLPPPNYSPSPPSAPTTSTGCPVGLVTGLTLDEEFGVGTSQITRCLIFRNGIN